MLIDIPLASDVQIFTSGSGTWTKPTTCAPTIVRVIIVSVG